MGTETQKPYYKAAKQVVKGHHNAGNDAPLTNIALLALAAWDARDDQLAQTPFVHYHGREPVIVAVDFEKFEGRYNGDPDQGKVTEVGVSILDTALTHNVAPGIDCKNWVSLAENHHIVIKENYHLRNKKYIVDKKDEFIFGKTKSARDNVHLNIKTSNGILPIAQYLDCLLTFDDERPDRLECASIMVSQARGKAFVNAPAPVGAGRSIEAEMAATERITLAAPNISVVPAFQTVVITTETPVEVPTMTSNDHCTAASLPPTPSELSKPGTESASGPPPLAVAAERNIPGIPSPDTKSASEPTTPEMPIAAPAAVLAGKNTFIQTCEAPTSAQDLISAP